MLLRMVSWTHVRVLQETQIRIAVPFKFLGPCVHSEWDCAGPNHLEPSFYLGYVRGLRVPCPVTLTDLVPPS